MNSSFFLLILIGSLVADGAPDRNKDEQKCTSSECPEGSFCFEGRCVPGQACSEEDVCPNGVCLNPEKGAQDKGSSPWSAWSYMLNSWEILPRGCTNCTGQQVRHRMIYKENCNFVVYEEMNCRSTKACAEAQPLMKMPLGQLYPATKATVKPTIKIPPKSVVRQEYPHLVHQAPVAIHSKGEPVSPIVPDHSRKRGETKTPKENPSSQEVNNENHPAPELVTEVVGTQDDVTHREKNDVEDPHDSLQDHKNMPDISVNLVGSSEDHDKNTQKDEQALKEDVSTDTNKSAGLIPTSLPMPGRKSLIRPTLLPMIKTESTATTTSTTTTTTTSVRRQHKNMPDISVNLVGSSEDHDKNTNTEKDKQALKEDVSTETQESVGPTLMPMPGRKSTLLPMIKMESTATTTTSTTTTTTTSVRRQQQRPSASSILSTHRNTKAPFILNPRVTKHNGHRNNTGKINTGSNGRMEGKTEKYSNESSSSSQAFPPLIRSLKELKSVFSAEFDLPTSSRNKSPTSGQEMNDENRPAPELVTEVISTQEEMTHREKNDVEDSHSSLQDHKDMPDISATLVDSSENHDKNTQDEQAMREDVSTDTHKSAGLGPILMPMPGRKSLNRPTLLPMTKMKSTSTTTSTTTTTTSVRRQHKNMPNISVTRVSSSEDPEKNTQKDEQALKEDVSTDTHKSAGLRPTLMPMPTSSISSTTRMNTKAPFILNTRGTKHNGHRNNTEKINTGSNGRMEGKTEKYSNESSSSSQAFPPLFLSLKGLKSVFSSEFDLPTSSRDKSSTNAPITYSQETPSLDAEGKSASPRKAPEHPAPAKSLGCPFCKNCFGCLTCNAFPRGIAIQTFPKIADPITCAGKCYKTTDCDHFIYMGVSEEEKEKFNPGDCVLRRGKSKNLYENARYFPNLISGRKDACKNPDEI